MQCFSTSELTIEIALAGTHLEDRLRYRLYASLVRCVSHSLESGPTESTFDPSLVPYNHIYGPIRTRTEVMDPCPEYRSWLMVF
jgi:hypothetical protein